MAMDLPFYERRREAPHIGLAFGVDFSADADMKGVLRSVLEPCIVTGLSCVTNRDWVEFNVTLIVPHEVVQQEPEVKSAVERAMKARNSGERELEL
ncbi:MAG: hypothetical protein Q8K86_00215 [Candidatus Nanopelagicaceae bacterium]|nr:hypothetical protein [Candidatus Nanopelagicaceae bacterium]